MQTERFEKCWKEIKLVIGRLVRVERMLAIITAMLAVGLVNGRASGQEVGGATVHLPYVLVEFAHSASGAAQPEVVSPAGRVIVNSNGVIESGLAGKVGSLTQTDGLQEAINYAVATGEDVYIEGGYALGRSSGRFNNNVYFLNKTLAVPPAQDFRIDGGESVINYNPLTGNAITINSCEDCHFRFGVVVTGGTNAAAVAFDPTGPTEVDGIRVVTDSTFRFSSIATNRPVGTSLAAIELAPAPGAGSVLWNTIDATATVGFQYNLYTNGRSSSAGVFNNRISVGHDHQATKALAYVGRFTSGNIFTLNDSSNGYSTTGVISYGTNNDFVLQSDSGVGVGRDIVFEKGSTGNLVEAVGPFSCTDYNPGRANGVISAQSVAVGGAGRACAGDARA